MTGPFVVCIKLPPGDGGWFAMRDAIRRHIRQFSTVKAAEEWIDARDPAWLKMVHSITIMPLAQYIIEQGL